MGFTGNDLGTYLQAGFRSANKANQKKMGYLYGHLEHLPYRRLAGTKNFILFSTYVFAYDNSIKNSIQSDRILFSYHGFVTTVTDRIENFQNDFK